VEEALDGRRDVEQQAGVAADGREVEVREVLGGPDLVVLRRVGRRSPAREEPTRYTPLARL